MKTSPLRTWLRQERAREHHWTLYWRLFEVTCKPDETRDRLVVPAAYDPIMREPSANKHIHGRDCDGTPYPLPGMYKLLFETTPPRLMVCGVRGEQ